MQHEIIDPTPPVLTGKGLADHVEGYTVLQAQTRQDYTQFDAEIAIFMHMKIGSYYEAQRIHVNAFDTLSEPSLQELVISVISDKANTKDASITRHDFSMAFDPISEPHATTGNNIPATGLSASSFDRPLSIISIDLAPYVRSIINYDLHLEEQRERLSELLSLASSGTSRSSKRLRTTRASRSALEGGKRATTRREKWFTAKDLDFNTVLRTGGKDWPSGLQMQVTEYSPSASMETGSRGSSTDPLLSDGT